MMLYRAAHDLRPTGVPAGKDGRWLRSADGDPARGASVAAARELVDMLPSGDEFTAYPKLEEMRRSFADARWLWPGWIPRGMVTLLGAAPGMGKSLVALGRARRIIAGERSPLRPPGAAAPAAANALGCAGAAGDR